MREFDIIIEEMRFVCKLLEDGKSVEIAGFRGNVARISVPECVEKQKQSFLVKGVAKKAFLGNHVMRKVVLPKTVEWIGDWAFAQCEQLEQVVILSHEINMGTGVFMDCNRIESIVVGGEENSMAKLLATTVAKMPSEDLLRDSEMGSSHWFAKWDQRLQGFLAESDDDGYTDLVLCGEEDITRSETEFAGDKRRRKAGLCMCRLMNGDEMDDASKNTYLSYLQQHTKGCSTEEAWEYIVQEHSNDISYYRKFGELECITQDNIDAMIEDLAAENAEAKAFLLQYKRDHFTVEDVFDMFSL